MSAYVCSVENTTSPVGVRGEGVEEVEGRKTLMAVKLSCVQVILAT